ncbi:MAG TPA: polysaccharide deacetylase family protein [Steroidobacteraceae bacterium]|nr:polysaccharide deacetylase family protein [Steroidobacteraceae bacterium]
MRAKNTIGRPYRLHGGAPAVRRHRGRIQLAVEAAERIGIVRALRPLHDRRNASLTVLAYHRVMPADALETYPFDPELISATPAQFAWQMEYIRRTLNPVSLEQVLAHLDGKAALPPRALAVTFDDGFADTYRYAFPILKRFSIPATIFVTTGNVDSGEPFWFELAAYLIYRVEPHALEVEAGGQRFPSGPTPRERTQSLRALHDILKSVPNAQRLALLSGWARRFAPQIEHGAVGHGVPISWAEVREMAAAGIAFGSHSVSHPNLTQLADAELDWELLESKRTIEEKLQRGASTLAYPIGNRAAFDERVIGAARRAGYRLGVSYLPGANALATLDRFELHRHGIGLGTSERYFRALTSLCAWIG